MTRRLAPWMFLVCASCSNGPTVDQAIRSWIQCEECVGKELAQLKAKGNTAVGPLVTALIAGPGLSQIANVTAQAAADRVAAERFRSRRPDAVPASAAGHPVDSAGYVSSYVTAYTESYRRRALLGLAAINTKAAIDSIKKVWARDSLTPIIGWGPEMHELARAYSHGVTKLSVRPIPVIPPGQSTQVVVWVTARPGVSSAVVWVSDNPAIATISASGKVTGMVGGSSRITACIAGLPAICASTPVRVQ